MAEPAGIDADILVIGAGRAGVSAARAAAGYGARVILVDHRDSVDERIGDAPQVALPWPHGAGSVRRVHGMVWNLRRGFAVEMATAAGNRVMTAPALVLTPGLRERLMPFPGATLPGIVGLAAAGAMVAAGAQIAGRRLLIAGAGPGLAELAASVLRQGGEVVAVADLCRYSDWARALAAHPRRLDRASWWLKLLHRRGVPYFWRHAIAATGGAERADSVRLTPVDRDGRPMATGPDPSFAIDLVAVDHGFFPATEMHRLLGLAQKLDRLTGNWTAVSDPFGRTSIEGLFAPREDLGDMAAELAGQAAGLLAAQHMGAAGAGAAAARIGRRLRQARNRDDALARLARYRDGLVDLISPDTVICPCENVRRGTLDAALEEGAILPGQIKAWTRCGMGLCQGRRCWDAVAAVVAGAGIPRETFGQMSIRPPLHPIPVDLVTRDPAPADGQPAT